MKAYQTSKTKAGRAGIVNALPPVFTVAPTTASVSAYGAIQFTATTSGGGTITYSLVTYPAGTTINASTGLVTLGSTSGTVTVRASASGLTADASCAVTVSGGVVGDAYYVATTGNDTTGDGSASNPWRTPAYGASRLTTDGKTLYLRAGTYDVDTSIDYLTCAISPRANNCTISAYPGESVTLRGGRSGVYGAFPAGGVIGSMSNTSGTLIYGLGIQGMAVFAGCVAGTRANRIERCTITVGGDGWTTNVNQGGVVFIDNAASVEIVNCKLTGNSQSPSPTPANNGLVMCYDCNGLLIENCNVYGSVGTGITMKDDVQNVVIRYNWIRDNNASGIWTGNNPVYVSHAKSGEIYQNIIANNNASNPESDEHGGICLNVYESRFDIYNNTFHRNYNAEFVDRISQVPWTFFNNLCYASRLHFLSHPYSSDPLPTQYLDFNGYYGSANWYYNRAAYSSLSAWRALIEPILGITVDGNSVLTDPGFLNASSSWSLPTDYRRASYAANGRGGSYASVMGAYVTGTEIIGASW